MKKKIFLSGTGGMLGEAFYEVFKKFIRVGLLPEKVISLCSLVGNSYHLSSEQAEALKNQ